jgi:hypothetical protein
MEVVQVAVLGPTGRRILGRVMRKSLDQPAQIVRGSSRRITIMRHRPANI